MRQHFSRCHSEQSLLLDVVLCQRIVPFCAGESEYSECQCTPNIYCLFLHFNDLCLQFRQPFQGGPGSPPDLFFSTDICPDDSDTVEFCPWPEDGPLQPNTRTWMKVCGQQNVLSVHLYQALDHGRQQSSLYNLLGHRIVCCLDLICHQFRSVSENLP
jgi:hypothetical protein